MKWRPLRSISRLSAELRRRKVYPVIAGYALVGWVLLQIGEVTFAPLGVPGFVMTGLIVIVIVGFPVVLALSWMFDLSSSGLRREAQLVLSPERHADDPPSIAVLPFADMSPNKDQAYFCEGVAEEILNALTIVPQLQVAARMSSFQFKDIGGDVRRIGRRLGVATILEGSVRKFQDKLRVTAQLVNVEDGYHLWSKHFDRKVEDIFAIQDEIATSIAQSLLTTLKPVKAAISHDVNAYDYYLRGRHFFNRFRKVDIEFARQMFRQAIDRDPGFALAWAGFADCYSFMAMYVDPKPNYRAEASKASQRALELSPKLAEAHASRGLVHLVSEEFASAEKEFDEALHLNPHLFEAYYYYGRTRFHQGDMVKAAEMFAKAAEVNPLDYQSRLLRVQILSGIGPRELALAEARQAIPVVEKHLEWNPDDTRALQLGAGSLVLLGETERALAWLQRAMQIDPDDPVLLYNLACNYANLGKAEAALDALEGAIKNGAVSRDWMRNDNDLISLREHPRFASLLEAARVQPAAEG